MTVSPELINIGKVANDGTGDRPRPMAMKYNRTVTALAAAINAGITGATITGGRLIISHPDGTTTDVGGTGDTQPTVTLPGLTAIAPAPAALLTASDASGNLGPMSLAALLQWILANDGSVDLAKLVPLTSVPNDFAVPGLTNGGPCTVLWSTLKGTISTGSSGSGSTGSGNTAAANGGGATTYPSVVWTTQPTFETANPIAGTASLKGGTGTVTFTLPPNAKGNNLTSYKMLFKYRSKTSQPLTGTDRFIFLTSSNGVSRGFSFCNSGNSFVSPVFNIDHNLSGVVRDQQVHTLEYSSVGDYGAYEYSDARVDGGSPQNISNGASPPPLAGTATLTIDMSKLDSGDVLDAIWITTDTDTHDVPNGEPARDAKTLVLLTFNDQTGNGS